MTIARFIVPLLIAVLLVLFRDYSFTAQTPWRVVAAHAVTQKEVMSLLTDFRQYNRWNTFVYDIISYDGHILPGRGIGRGDKATLKVRLRIPGTSCTFTKLMLDFEIGEISDDRLCWHYQMVPKVLQPYSLHTTRCMVLRNVASPAGEKVEIMHFDRNTGPLAPLVQLLFKGIIQEGFEQMTDDLIKYINGENIYQ